MMIIGKDNYDRESIADKLLVSGIPDTDRNYELARGFCDWLNDIEGEHGAYHYIVVENDYRLWRGMADLV